MFLDDERVILNSTFYILNLLKGIYSYGDPPLPIPNREVKPVSADGTAIPSGRVGSRQLTESIQRNLDALFFCVLPTLQGLIRRPAEAVCNFYWLMLLQ